MVRNKGIEERMMRDQLEEDKILDPSETLGVKTQHYQHMGKLFLAAATKKSSHLSFMTYVPPRHAVMDESFGMTVKNDLEWWPEEANRDERELVAANDLELVAAQHKKHIETKGSVFWSTLRGRRGNHRVKDTTRANQMC